MPDNQVTARDIARVLEYSERATPGPWGLCAHLESKASDESCPCGYRGGIWGGDGERIICEMGNNEEIPIPTDIRREVLSSGPCVRCGTSHRLTIDHIIPVSRGGKNHRGNLQPMCGPCNSRKGARVAE